MDDPKVRGDKALGPGARQGVRRREGRRSARAPVSGAGDRPARSAAAAGSRRRAAEVARRPGKPWTPTSGRRSTAGQRDERGAHQHDLGAWRLRAIRAVVPRAAAAVRIAATRASARWWSTRSARCPATRRSSRCERRSRTRRPTCAGTRRSRWRGTAASEGVPVLQQMLDRAYVEQTVKRDDRPGRGPGSGRRCHDQRPARGGGAEGRVAAAVDRRR